MGRLDRVMKIGKWTAVLIVVMVMVPGVLAAATYTSPSFLGNVAATVLPPVQSVPAQVYNLNTVGGGAGLAVEFPITHTKIEWNCTFYGHTNDINLKLKTPNSTIWVSLRSNPRVQFQNWTTPTGNVEPYNGITYIISTPLLTPYDAMPSPVIINMTYEIFKQVYSVLKDNKVINCSMDQVVLIKIQSSFGNSAKVWVDGSSPLVTISTTRFYSWLGYRVVNATLDGTPVTFDGSSVTLPTGTVGNHVLEVTLRSWVPIFATKASLQIVI